MGGRVGIADHVTIGAGAQIAAGSGVMRTSRPARDGAATPAKPAREWLRGRCAAATGSRARREPRQTADGSE